MSSYIDCPILTQKAASSQGRVDDMVQDTSRDSSTATEISSSDVDVSPKQEEGERDYSVFTMGS